MICFANIRVMDMRDYIKNCREEAGLTQLELAEKMGVSVVSVQNWEKGRTKIEMSRMSELASILNVPVENLIKEILIEEDKLRPDRWPDFLFDQETNSIIDSLHLNHAQQELFGLLYIYGKECLTNIDTEEGRNIFDANLRKIPFGFIDKVGSIRFMNQAEGLFQVIQYVNADFLLKILKQNPYAEFNIRKLTKDQIMEFVDEGFKNTDEGLNFRISMKKARIILPVLQENKAVHITDGDWFNTIRSDIPENVLSSILKMCGFKRDLWQRGYYKDKNNIAYIRHGLEELTEYHNISPEGDVQCWMWELNDKGNMLLEWFSKN